mgnify:CR=1 FL=1
MSKPISQPCLRNQEPIYQALKDYFKDAGNVLELACGTAQHAVYFAQRLPHLNWQPSDVGPAIEGARLWIDEACLDNLKPVLMLNIEDDHWSNIPFDYIYSANLVHFISMESVNSMFSGIKKHLKRQGFLALYGPYNQNGYTSEGNVRLDEWLKADINSKAGIKELDEVIQLAKHYGLQLEADHAMPANNHLLIFRKIT